MSCFPHKERLYQSHMSFPEALWVCCGWVFTLEGVPLLSPSPGTATASPTGSVHLEPRNPQPTCAGWALFAFIANQNHSFGVSKSIIPTPHNLVPIYGIVLLPCSQLGKHPLTKICTSPLPHLSSMFLLPYLCHCVWGILFMTDPLSCVLGSSQKRQALPPDTTPTTRLLHDLLRQSERCPYWLQGQMRGQQFLCFSLHAYSFCFVTYVTHWLPSPLSPT